VLFLRPQHAAAALALLSRSASASGPGHGRTALLVPGVRRLHHAAIDEVDVGQQRLVVVPGLLRRAPRQHRRHQRPPVRHLLRERHQRALEHLVLRLAPRPAVRHGRRLHRRYPGRRLPAHAVAVRLVVVGHSYCRTPLRLLTTIAGWMTRASEQARGGRRPCWLLADCTAPGLWPPFIDFEAARSARARFCLRARQHLSSVREGLPDKRAYAGHVDRCG
jgi:hypothetical protein